MRIGIVAVAVLLAAPALVACDPQYQNVRLLQLQVLQLEDKVKKLQDKVYDLASAAPAAIPATQTAKAAVLDPSTTAYDIAQNRSGVLFFVAVEKVAPYADGQRVILKIGNPSAATFSNAKLALKWGGRPDWSRYAEWAKSLRSKEETIMRDLRAGRWTSVPVVLSPATPNDIAHIEAEVETSMVVLGR